MIRVSLPAHRNFKTSQPKFLKSGRSCREPSFDALACSYNKKHDYLRAGEHTAAIPHMRPQKIQNVRENFAHPRGSRTARACTPARTHGKRARLTSKSRRKTVLHSSQIAEKYIYFCVASLLLSSQEDSRHLVWHTRHLNL